MDMPDLLTNYTADEIAESVDYHPHLTKDEGDALYTKLWGFLDEANAAGTATPVGGDGSNGTAETPGDRIDPNATDTAPHFWPRLSDAEQRAICMALNMR